MSILKTIKWMCEGCLMIFKKGENGDHEKYCS